MYCYLRHSLLDTYPRKVTLGATGSRARPTGGYLQAVAISFFEVHVRACV